jgi:hypothetical protein
MAQPCIEGTEVDVTIRHIRSGTPGECHLCPIAIALQEKFPRMPILVSWEHQGGAHFLVAIVNYSSYVLPHSAASFAKKYDNNEEVRPFSFKVGRKL